MFYIKFYFAQFQPPYQTSQQFQFYGMEKTNRALPKFKLPRYMYAWREANTPHLWEPKLKIDKFHKWVRANKMSINDMKATLMVAYLKKT